MHLSNGMPQSCKQNKQKPLCYYDIIFQDIKQKRYRHKPQHGTIHKKGQGYTSTSLVNMDVSKEGNRAARDKGKRIGQGALWLLTWNSMNMSLY